MIQESGLASPGGVPQAQCHWIQRPEFVSEPSSSAKHVVGEFEDGCLDFLGLHGIISPWFSQNRAVAVCSGSMLTRNLELG